MNDDIVTIKCGECGKDSPFHQWTSTAIEGELPKAEYQCPKCKYAFKRSYHPEAKPWQGSVTLDPIQPRL